MLKVDPPRRADGRYFVCPKTIVITEAARKYAGVQLDLDPFCSVGCCRKWHGTELALVGTEEQAAAREELGRVRSQLMKDERGWDDDVEDAA